MVVVFALLLYGAYAVLGRTLFAAPKDRYFADFEDASGLVSGSAVTMAGLAVGSVSETKLMNPRLARVTLEINPGTRVPAGSEAVIPGSLLSISQGAVQITPPEKPSSDYLAPGAVIPGRRASALEQAIPGAKDTMAELTKTIKSTRELIEDQGLRKDMRTLMQTSNDTLKKFGALSAQTQGLIAENRVMIAQSLRNASLAMKDVQEGTRMVVEAMRKGNFEQRTAQMLERLNATSAKAEHLVSSLDELINEKGVREPIKSTLQNTATLSESGVKIAKSTEVIAKNGEAVSEKAVEIAGKANDLADEAKKTLEDIRGFFGKGRTPKPLNIAAEMDVLQQQRPSYWRTDIEFSSKFNDTGYHIGIWDAFESNKFIIQLGRDAGKGLYYRYGIYAAKPGVGVDYRLNDRVHLRGDLFDLNDPRFDLRMRVNLGRGLYGWLGADRIFERATPTVGVGFQK